MRLYIYMCIHTSVCVHLQQPIQFCFLVRMIFILILKFIYSKRFNDFNNNVSRSLF